MDRWEGVKAVLRIAHSSKKLSNLDFSAFRLSSPIVSSLVTFEATPTTRYKPWSSKPEMKKKMKVEV